MSAPISLVPSEILSKIFVFVVTDSPKVYLKSPRFVLISVSSRWRAVALNNPELWTYISLQASSSTPKSTIRRNVKIAKLWLGRSRNLPISLELKDYSEDRGSYWVHANLIRQYAARLRTLKVWDFTTSPYFATTVKTPTPVQLPSLENLILVDHHIYARRGPEIGTIQSSDNDAESLYISVPNIKRAVIMYDSKLSARIFTPQNNQLTHLFFSTPMSYKTWRHILKECSTHLECGAFYIGDVDEPAVAYQEVILNSLTRLSVSMDHPSALFLQGIICPSLQSFYIGGTTFDVDKHFLRVIAPIHRLCISAKNKTLNTKQEYVTIFTAAPLLEVLIFKFDECTESGYKLMLDALAPTTAHDILPRLTSLIIFGRLAEFPSDSFIDLLDSRWKDKPLLSEADGETCRLADVEVHYRDPLGAERSIYLSALERLRAEGLRVVLKKDQLSLTWSDWLRLELHGMDWAKGVDIGVDVYSENLRKALM